MKKINIIFLMLLILMVTACSNSRIVSMVDPELVNVKYDKLVIFSSAEDLFLKKEIEDTVAKQIDLEVYRSYKLLSPVADYSLTDAMEKLKEFGLSGILVITLVNTRTEKETEITPAFFELDLTEKKISYKGANKIIHEKPIVEMEARIYDVNYGMWSWISKVNSEGVEIHDYLDLITKSGQKINEQLKMDGKI